MGPTHKTFAQCNTNQVINVTIDRMNTDTLGGGRVTTGDVDATSVSKPLKHLMLAHGYRRARDNC